MCHEYAASDWVWDADEPEETAESDDETPEFLNEESEVNAELVTDGGDES